MQRICYILKAKYIYNWKAHIHMLAYLNYSLILYVNVSDFLCKQ